METKHTPIDTDALMVILLSNGYRGDRAEIIVRAVNAHEELVKAVLEFHNELDRTGKYPARCEELRNLLAKAEKEC